MALPHDEQELLSRILHFFRGELLEDVNAHDHLRRLGIVERNLLESLSLGLAKGGLLKMLPEDEAALATAKTLGFLDPEGRERFGGHLTIPLKSHKGHLCGYGALDLENDSETLTLFEPVGCLYPSEIRQAKRACLAVSALDALLLAQAGEKASVVAPAHEAERHLARFSEFSFKEAILAFEDERLAEICAQALAAQGIEPLTFSLAGGKRLRDLLRAGIGFEELLRRAAPVSVQAAKPDIERSEDGLLFTWPDRTYRVRLLDPRRFDHMRVSIKLAKDHRWHLDSVDLSLAKQRQTFIHMAKKVVRMEPATLYQDLLAVTEEVERHQAERLLQAKKVDTALSEELRREGEAFLTDPAMFDRLAEDFRMLGWLGDPNAAVIGYLTLASRKLSWPLALAWAEGAEPVKLPSVLLPLLPPEDLVYLTRPSPKALLYQEEEALAHRLIAAETHTLSSEVSSCLAKLAAGEELHAQVVMREAQTGRLKTATHRVKGPCALFLIVSKNGQGAQRKLSGAPFLPVRGRDEIPGAEQDAWFLRKVEGGWLEGDALRERIIARHRAAQRLLQPCDIRNPHARELLEKERDPVRRQRLADLAGAVAFLRQRQKQVQSQRGREYVQVDEADLTLAEQLVGALSDGGWPVLPAGTRRVLAVIQHQIDGRASGAFTRSDVIAWTGLGMTTTREHLDRLESEGYLSRVGGGSGQAWRYHLVEGCPLGCPPEGRRVPESELLEREQVGTEAAGVAPLAPHNGSG